MKNIHIRLAEHVMSSQIHELEKILELKPVALDADLRAKIESRIKDITAKAAFKIRNTIPKTEVKQMLNLLEHSTIHKLNCISESIPPIEPLGDMIQQLTKSVRSAMGTDSSSNRKSIIIPAGDINLN